MWYGRQLFIFFSLRQLKKYNEAILITQGNKITTRFCYICYRTCFIWDYVTLEKKQKQNNYLRDYNKKMTKINTALI